MKLVCEVFGVSRSNASARQSRPAMWHDGHQFGQIDGASVMEEIRRVVGDLPSYGYRRVCGTLCNDRVAVGLVPLNVKRIYRVMRAHGLLMRRRVTARRSQRRHDGKVAAARSNQRWRSDGFEFRSDCCTQRKLHCKPQSKP